MGNWYADFASQADDDAHNRCRDPSEQRAGVDDGRAQRYQQPKFDKTGLDPARFLGPERVRSKG